MNIFQRISATITSHVSDVVSHVENHDAIVEAALRETHAAAAKARIRLNRLRRDGESMRRTLDELTRMESVWEERAVTAAGEDEAKALECVKRRNHSRKQKEQAAAMLARHDETEREVGVTVARIEERITALTQQRNTLRSRHSAADALRVINRIEDTSAHGIEDIFDRWEILIAETEYASGDARHSDAFESAYAREDSDAALKADLDALVKKTAL